jgi:predicted transport protein
MKNFEKAEQTMIGNLVDKYSKSLNEWIQIAKASNNTKHKAIADFLKKEHNFTHGYATLIAHKTLATDAASADGPDQLIEGQYKGKGSLKAIYDKIIKELQSTLPSMDIAPKKAYVSLRNKRQFAMIQPSTKTRIDIGIKLKEHPITNRLESSGNFNIMCTHKIKIQELEEIDSELIDWLKTAYENAG